MEKVKKVFNYRSPTFYLMAFICCIILAAVLRIASSIILPLVIAILLSLVMYPFVKLLDKCKFPRFLSIFFVIIILIAVLFLFGFVLTTSGRSIVDVHTEYEEGRIEYILHSIAQFFDFPFDEDITIWQNLWAQLGIRAFILDFAVSIGNTFITFLSNAIIVIFFVLFILLEASFFKTKLRVAFPKHSSRIGQISHDIMTQVARYIAAKFFISLANGIIFATAFHFIGLEFAILWGVIQFVMNFIPALGSIVTGIGISFFALVQFWPEPVPVILVIVVVLGVNLGTNTLDPKIVGERVGISPLVVLASLVFWGWIWGFAGMILAVPMASIIKIVCENVPMLKPVSVLIGTRRSVKAKQAEQEKSELLKAKNENKTEVQAEPNKTETQEQTEA